MEKKQFRDHYLPFTAAKPVKAGELLEQILKPAGNYNKLDTGQRALLFIYSKIAEAENNIIGPTFSLPKNGVTYPMPAHWAPVISYLKEGGFINDFAFEPLYCDELKVIRTIFIANQEILENLTDGKKPKSSKYTHGDDFGCEIAIAKVIGEFLERFSLLLYREKEFLKSSVSDLIKKNILHLDISRLTGFSDEQKEKRGNLKFDEQSDFFWARGVSLFDNKTCLIPAQLIFWNYQFNHQGWVEPFLREPNTNGAGGHYTWAEAMLSGLYELIQRDGFLIYWLNKQAPPQIDAETTEYKPLKDALEECRHLNFDVRFFDTTSDLGIPSCICAVLDHTGVGPKISMGGGCEMNYSKMLLRALLEATGVWHWSRRRKEEMAAVSQPAVNCESFKDRAIGQLERINLWADDEMFEKFSFFLSGERKSIEDLEKKAPKFSSADEELACLIKKFKSLGKGYEIFYYQAKNKILDDLGYFSVKVIVPALIPLYLIETFMPLGAKRLKEVPEKLGFKAADSWNSLPHPFP